MADTAETLKEILSSKITITYPNGKAVELGQELSTSDVVEEPKVSWNADSVKFYTLLMYDPDAPSRHDPKFADVKHWLVVNIPGCDVKSGEVIAEYVGSGPPEGTGLHRYIFLAYEQRERLEFDEPKDDKLSRAHRINWSMRAFRKKYDLRKVYAGNYFQAQWDPSVDVRRKEREEASKNN